MCTGIAEKVMNTILMGSPANGFSKIGGDLGFIPDIDDDGFVLTEAAAGFFGGSGGGSIWAGEGGKSTMASPPGHGLDAAMHAEKRIRGFMHRSGASFDARSSSLIRKSTFLIFRSSGTTTSADTGRSGASNE